MKFKVPALVGHVLAGALFLSTVALSQQPQPTPVSQPSGAPHYITNSDYDALTRSAGKVRPEDVSGLEKRATSGNLDSQLLLATLYRWGCGVVKPDPVASLEWYHKAADQGSSIAANEIGNYQKAMGSNNDALRWYRRAADHLDASGEHNLGLLLAESKGPDASTWLRRAAEHGDDLAVEDLMKLYNQGTADPQKSLEENRREGLMLLQSWAGEGRAAAQVELALSYSTGQLGLKKDPALAFQWMRKAADKSPEAEAFLGQFYNAGIGTQPNIQEAVRWDRKAAEHGHWRGQMNLADRYEQGHGVEKDPAQAVRWYEAAAAQHDYPDAMYQLAHMYETGHGVPKDKITALMWFILARQTGALNQLPPKYSSSSLFTNPSKRDLQEAQRRAEAWWEQHACGWSK
jgi:TPR repeat protein